MIAIDLSNPSHPRDRIASEHGWGWLFLSSGYWGVQTIALQ